MILMYLHSYHIITMYTMPIGAVPPSDAVGCLQDIHWAGGAMGYFPTYTLGKLTYTLCTYHSYI